MAFVGSKHPQPCAKGTYNDQGGQTACKTCTAGTYNDQEGQQTCKACPAMTYQDRTRQTACKACTEGYYCAEGAAAALPCPGGTHKNASLAVMTSVEQCVTCPAGTSCSVGSAEPSPCLPGAYGASASQESCERCPGAAYQDEYGQTTCKGCVAGSYCVNGSSEPSGDADESRKKRERAPCSVFARTQPLRRSAWP